MIGQTRVLNKTEGGKQEAGLKVGKGDEATIGLPSQSPDEVEAGAALQTLVRLRLAFGAPDGLAAAADLFDETRDHRSQVYYRRSISSSLCRRACEPSSYTRGTLPHHADSSILPREHNLRPPTGAPYDRSVRAHHGNRCCAAPALRPRAQP